MKFTIISHAIHKQEKDLYYSYEPYIREMNLWEKYVSEIKIVAPLSKEGVKKIESAYTHSKISLIEVKSLYIKNLKNTFQTLLNIPIILYKIYKAMKWADHIHLRCPGNIGLLGVLVQILFPNKPKTVKYAGNWDPNSKQPFSYRIQKSILSNTFLTRNCKVLVYGNWKNQTKNIIPFFTASYKESEIVQIPLKKLSDKIKFMFVGGFTEGKQPMISVQTVQYLKEKGYDVELNMYGDGVLFEKVKQYIIENGLEQIVFLHGNQSKETVKLAYQKSHFLIFISKSEGWPKVVAESMFWGCLPISSNVSCVADMLDEGKRGSVLPYDISPLEISKKIEQYISNEDMYLRKVAESKEWSQQYTLDSFEQAIKKLIEE